MSSHRIVSIACFVAVGFASQDILPRLASAIDTIAPTAEATAARASVSKMNTAERKVQVSRMAAISRDISSQLSKGDLESARKSVIRLREVSTPFYDFGEPRIEGFIDTIPHWEAALALPTKKLDRLRKAFALQRETVAMGYMDRRNEFQNLLEARELLRDALGEDSLFVREATNGLCVALGAARHAERMESEAKATFDQAVKRYGRGHQFSIESRTRYADALCLKEDYIGAERLYAENLAIIERRCPQQLDTILTYAMPIFLTRVRRSDTAGALTFMDEYVAKCGRPSVITGHYFLALSELALLDGDLEKSHRIFDNSPIRRTSTDPYSFNLEVFRFRAKLAFAERNFDDSDTWNRVVSRIENELKNSRAEIDEAYKSNEDRKSRTASTPKSNATR